MQPTKPWPHIPLLPSQTPWGCLPTAFCMATGIPYPEWIKAIGHDGGQIVFEYLPEPQNRRGFHPQEMIRAALSFGIGVTELQVNPVITTDGVNRYPVAFEGGNVLSFSTVLRGQRAVVGGVTNKGVGHAVAFDGDLWLVFDPARTAPATLWDGLFTPKLAYILHRLA
jgi:hypothetical protein